MTSKSNSIYQKEKEGIIRELLEVELKMKLTSGVKNLSGVHFQLDIMNDDRNLYGEIYVCQFPLKSGQIRKIKSDLLKLITLEKILIKPGIQKIMVLTIGEKDRYKITNSSKTVLKHNQDINLMGLNSWLNRTIEVFGIEFYYVVLNDQQYYELSMVRNLQKEGISE